MLGFFFSTDSGLLLSLLFGFGECNGDTDSFSSSYSSLYRIVLVKLA